MECVLELLHLVRIAYYLDLFLVVRLKHTVSLYDFPDGLFVLGEGSVLSGYLALVLNRDLFCVVSEDVDRAVVKLVFVDGDDGTDGSGEDSDHERNVVSLHLDIEGDSDS